MMPFKYNDTQHKVTQNLKNQHNGTQYTHAQHDATQDKYTHKNNAQFTQFNNTYYKKTENNIIKHLA